MVWPLLMSQIELALERVDPASVDAALEAVARICWLAQTPGEPDLVVSIAEAGEGGCGCDPA